MYFNAEGKAVRSVGRWEQAGQPIGRQQCLARRQASTQHAQPAGMAAHAWCDKSSAGQEDSHTHGCQRQAGPAWAVRWPRGRSSAAGGATGGGNSDQVVAVSTKLAKPAQRLLQGIDAHAACATV